MNVHQNARLTPLRRRELIRRLESGELGRAVATRLGVSLRTVRKWWGRYRAEGVGGLLDRSSRPHASPRQTAPAIALGIQVLRLQRWTCAQIGGAGGGERGDRGADLTARRAIATRAARSAADHPALRTPSSWGSAPSRHQAARSHRGGGASLHRAGRKRERPSRHWVGVPAHRRR